MMAWGKIQQTFTSVINFCHANTPENKKRQIPPKSFRCFIMVHLSKSNVGCDDTNYRLQMVPFASINFVPSFTPYIWLCIELSNHKYMHLMFITPSSHPNMFFLAASSHYVNQGTTLKPHRLTASLSSIVSCNCLVGWIRMVEIHQFACQNKQLNWSCNLSWSWTMGYFQNLISMVKLQMDYSIHCLHFFNQFDVLQT